MPTGTLGRKILLRWGDDSPPASLAGVREKSITMNGEPVDVTDSNSDGWREVLSEPGEHQIEISVSGIIKDDALRQAWFGTTARQNSLELEYPDGATITGEFFLSSYAETGPYNNATTFEATFVSSGVIVYTPAA